MRCAMLQQAVGEASGRGADIEAGAAFDGNGPMLERSLELEATAADVALLFSQDANGNLVGKREARLVDLLLGNQDPAGEDERAGSLPARDKPFLNHKHIDSCPGRGRHPSDSIMLL